MTTKSCNMAWKGKNENSRQRRYYTRTGCEFKDSFEILIGLLI